VIGVKYSIDAHEDEDESTNTCSSSKALGKKAKANEFLGLSESISKYSEAMVTAACIAAKQKEKDRCQAMEESTLSRIHSHRDTKRDLVIRLASSDIATNKALFDVILKEVAEIESEISQNEEKMKSIRGTPIKNNRSPK
jgi:hypothetical protein